MAFRYGRGGRRGPEHDRYDSHRALQAALSRREDPCGQPAETTKLAELTADDIEMYLRRRLKQRARW